MTPNGFMGITLCFKMKRGWREGEKFRTNISPEVILVNLTHMNSCFFALYFQEVLILLEFIYLKKEKKVIDASVGVQSRA